MKEHSCPTCGQSYGCPRGELRAQPAGGALISPTTERGCALGPEKNRPVDLILVREWDADQFHARVMELEKQGYVARRETTASPPR